MTSILQDKNGFMWIGTRGGLQRFNGYEMKLLKNDFGSDKNLLSQSIEVLQNGRENNIWIGTKSGGLSEYNLSTGKITNYDSAGRTIRDFNSDYVLSLFDADADRLLIGTWKGFAFLNKKKGQFTVVNSDWKTFDIQSDRTGGYWLATSAGLRHLNSNLENDGSYNFGFTGIDVTSIVVDRRENVLWLGTWQQGLIYFNPVTKQTLIYKHEDGNEQSLSSNNTYKILQDSNGAIWVGTWGGGLNLFDKASKTFKKIHLNIPGINTTDNQIILSIRETQPGLLWVGTDGTGFFKLDINQKKFLNIGFNNEHNPFNGSTHIIGTFVDPYNKLWIGRKGGQIKYSSNWDGNQQPALHDLLFANSSKTIYEARAFLQTGDYLWIATNQGLVRVVNRGNLLGKPEVFLPDKNDSFAISGRKLDDIKQDASGKIWIGTQEKGLSAIVGFDKANKPLFKNYLHKYGEQNAIQNERVSCLLVDSKDRLWFGTYKGLHLYNRANDDFKNFVQTNDPRTSISNNTVLCLAEDDAGNIWAGTQFGLNKITVDATGQLLVKRFTTKEGLPSDYIHAVRPDKNGIVWVSTNKGIIKINSVTGAINVFDKRDGIQSDIFSENASFRDKQGRFFFGGVEGLTYFHPDSIKINSFTPPLFFTNLSINNQPYEFGKANDATSVLNKPFEETESITLNDNQNIFSIQFAALDFHAPDKNDYMYKLEGFNKDWVYTGNERQVSFTNLKPGTYYLKVKATNSDKLWNTTVRQLKINILPPIWKTWWAYSIYIALFIFLLWLTRYLGLRELALKNQLALARLDGEQEKKLANYKERLFTNISHEFRTPLTLILGPLDDLLQRKKLEATVDKSLRLIQKQSKRMLRMVNQLLDFQKAEAGSLKLSPQPGELVSFCHDVYLLFKEEAARKNIEYVFESEDKFLSFTFDHNKLEIIIFNLLSNAFKFTGKDGFIKLSVRNRFKQYCEIIVEDNGAGIGQTEIDKIFDRFYRGKEMDAAAISGTGIGLSFVKELAELHGGTIIAQSDGIKGATFRLKLPFKSHVDGVLYDAACYPQIESSTNPYEMSDENVATKEMDQELPIILVVEDEADILQYIYEILSPSFKVVTATNGKEGLAQALEAIPDLVVSDVMMPEMDGMELCRMLKSDKRTSHIPVILLTALSDMAHHIQGIKEGADVYLPKPFNSQLLLVHIHNLIKSRDNLKELYAKRITLGVGKFEITTYEEEFLDKLVKLVEENITVSEFGNDDLANLMFMSRSTFYRKLKAVTGMSGNEFIRTARLNYAVKLLESGKYSVADAAFEAGFNDVKYFRKRFQDQFGSTPSEYKK
nr:two-component regulator propeller domain-containing protein [Flavisolibacter ginsenosidimutans]